MDFFYSFAVNFIKNLGTFLQVYATFYIAIFIFKNSTLLSSKNIKEKLELYRFDYFKNIISISLSSLLLLLFSNITFNDKFFVSVLKCNISVVKVFVLVLILLYILVVCFYFLLKVVFTEFDLEEKKKVIRILRRENKINWHDDFQDDSFKNNIEETNIAYIEVFKEEVKLVDNTEEHLIAFDVLVKQNPEFIYNNFRWLIELPEYLKLMHSKFKSKYDTGYENRLVKSILLNIHESYENKDLSMYLYSYEKIINTSKIDKLTDEVLLDCDVLQLFLKLAVKNNYFSEDTSNSVLQIDLARIKEKSRFYIKLLCDYIFYHFGMKYYEMAVQNKRVDLEYDRIVAHIVLNSDPIRFGRYSVFLYNRVFQQYKINEVIDKIVSNNSFFILGNFGRVKSFSGGDFEKQYQIVEEQEKEATLKYFEYIYDYISNAYTKDDVINDIKYVKQFLSKSDIENGYLLEMLEFLEYLSNYIKSKEQKTLLKGV